MSESFIQHPVVLIKSRATIIGFLFLIFFGLNTFAFAKPSRDQIVAYVAESKNQQKAFNLIEKFGSDFTRLDLSNLDLRGHYHAAYTNIFTGADFSYSDLHGTKLGSGNFDRVNFYKANLEGTEFITATLVGARFEKTNLKNVRFQECDLSKAMLSHADLSSAVISGCRFAGANLFQSTLSGATNNLQLDFSRANLKGANLKGVNLGLAIFREADLTNANLQNANLDEADFTGANLTNADLQNASIEFANFRNVRGLDKVTEKNLKRISKRSSYELEQRTLKLTRLLFWPAYFLIVLLTVATGLKLYRPLHKNKLYVFSCISNLFVLIPVIFSLFMLIVVDTVRQLSETLSILLAGFVGILWISLWPILYLVVIVGIPITFVMMIYTIIKRKHIDDTMNVNVYVSYSVLTFIHYLLAYVLITKYFFPDA